MKALQYKRYGGPEVLQWTELPALTPDAGQVLVLIKAASLNPTDSKIRSGALKFPGSDHFPKSMGMDFAGIVIKAGEGVTHVAEGSKVMGYLGPQGGAFADCVLAPAENTLLMPDFMDYADAATLPMNAATALKVVNEYIKPSPGKTILIVGATGGIGLFAVQFCKLAGAFVTGTVSSQEGLIKLVGIHTDEIIDYQKTDLIATGKKWDAILDTSGKMDFTQSAAMLHENGTFSTMVPYRDPSFPGRSLGSKKENLVFAIPSPEEFAAARQLAAEGKIKTFVGKAFSMKDAVDSIRQFDAGKLHVIGKVVLVNDKSGNPTM